ncbi:MAG: hypothetical protein AAF307_02250 [Pseudomonadota bacterium]
MKKSTPEDPKGLIFESYRIEGILKADCRTIFLDWALSLPIEQDTGAAIGTLLKSHGAQMPEHPMTQVLKEGLATMAAPRRRGGANSRRRV